MSDRVRRSPQMLNDPVGDVSLGDSLPETGSSSLHGGDAAATCRGNVAAEAKRYRIDYRALRERVTMAEVLTLVHWQPVERRGIQVRGPCPIHRSQQSTSRSLSINLQRQLFRCFGCNAKGNALDLFRLATGQPLFEAAWDLCERLGIEPPRATP